jgi:hypothetical protein
MAEISETAQGRREQSNIFKVLKRKMCQPRNPNLKKTLFSKAR